MKTRIITTKFRDFLVNTKFSRDDFVPLFINEKWYKPKYSLKKQADMRKGCILLGIDPSSINMPEAKVHKPLALNPPEGTKYQKNYLQRKEKVDKALAKMPTMISKWKEEIAAEKAKKISNIPF